MPLQPLVDSAVWLLSGTHCSLQEAAQEDAGGEALDSYVVVNKEDVLEAMGCFVASYLAQLPQAQNLQPAELQLAIKHAFKVRAHLCLRVSHCHSTFSSFKISVWDPLLAMLNTV